MLREVPSAIMHPFSSGETQYEVCSSAAVGEVWISFEFGREGQQCRQTATAQVLRFSNAGEVALRLVEGSMFVMKTATDGSVKKIDMRSKAPKKGPVFN